MTIWNSIPRYDGLYEASDDGRIRSLTRLVNTSNGKQRMTRGKELKPATRKYGHQFVSLWVGNKQKTERVHRLVLETFVGPCPEGMECRHLDGDASNNSVSNLVWGTHIENESDKVAHGTVANGERQGSSKLTERDVFDIRRNKEGLSQRQLGEKFNICQPHINRIISGQAWSWLGA